MEHQLPGEENDFRELFCDREAKVFQLVHRVGADGHVR